MGEDEMYIRYWIFLSAVAVCAVSLVAAGSARASTTQPTSAAVSNATNTTADDLEKCLQMALRGQDALLYLRQVAPQHKVAWLKSADASEPAGLTITGTC